VEGLGAEIHHVVGVPLELVLVPFVSSSSDTCGTESYLMRASDSGHFGARQPQQELHALRHFRY
jgi:hypothetical protein